jgi:hypothetical protein
MLKIVVVLPAALPALALSWAAPANATCPIPNTITNGQVADATQVMGNFNALGNCSVSTTGSTPTGGLSVFSGTKSVTGGNLTGDVTTSGTTATTLSNSGITPGTYTNPTITVDAKGRLTAASTGSGGTGGTILLGSQTASNSTALNFTNLVSSAYDKYVIEFVDIALATNGASLAIQFSTDNGSTWDANAIYDTSMFQTADNTYSGNASTINGTFGYVTQAYSTSTSNAVNGDLSVYNPSGSNFKMGTFHTATLKTDGHFYSNSGTIRYRNTSPVNAFRISSSSGNISSGIVRLYAFTH